MAGISGSAGTVELISILALFLAKRPRFMSGAAAAGPELVDSSDGDGVERLLHTRLY
jgi:hypothetical protein